MSERAFTEWLCYELDPETGCAEEGPDTMTCDDPECIRREWWYEPGEKYVFQDRPEGGGPWSELYEGDGEVIPEWVRATVTPHM